MKFNTKIGSFFKSNNYTPLIKKKILLTLILVSGIYIFLYKTNYIFNFIINTIIIIFINILLKFLQNILLKRKENINQILFSDDIIINSIIFSLILPEKISYLTIIMMTFISSITLFILERFINIKINYVIFTILIIIINTNFSFNDFMIQDEINIFILLTFIIINAYLFVNDCVKTDITIMYSLILIIGRIIYSYINNLNIIDNINITLGINNLIFLTYIINDNKTTSVIPYSKFVYSVIIGILSLISIRYNNIYIFCLSIILYNVFHKYIDIVVIENKSNKLFKRVVYIALILIFVISVL